VDAEAHRDTGAVLCAIGITELEYSIYIGSAESGERTTLCWSYADLILQ
jgi:hypothetical protein